MYQAGLSRKGFESTICGLLIVYLSDFGSRFSLPDRHWAGGDFRFTNDAISEHSTIEIFGILILLLCFEIRDLRNTA